MRPIAFVAAVTGAGIVWSVGSLMAAQIVTLSGTVTMAAVVAACKQTASSSQAGAVVLTGKLKDANCTATLDVPCAVQLTGKATISLKDCDISSQTLNIGDSASAAGKSFIHLDNVALHGDANAGLLIYLSDPADKLVVVGGSLSFGAGISLRAMGTREAPDHGGSVLLKKVSLSTGDAGLVVAGSTKGGRVVVADSSIASPTVIITGDKCIRRVGRLKAACASGAIATNLARQAAALQGSP